MFSSVISLVGDLLVIVGVVFWWDLFSPKPLPRKISRGGAEQER
jgi:cytochrome c oxidase assembly factor CtaG